MLFLTEESQQNAHRYLPWELSKAEWYGAKITKVGGKRTKGFPNFSPGHVIMCASLFQ